MPLARIGLVVPYALTQKLLDTVGTPMTKELLFTGALLDAESARRAGLVTRIVPDDELAAADALAVLARAYDRLVPTQQRPINNAEYYRLAELGIIGDKVELMDGWITFGQPRSGTTEVVEYFCD